MIPIILNKKTLFEYRIYLLLPSSKMMEICLFSTNFSFMPEMIFSNITLHWYHFTKATHTKIMHVMFFVRHIIAMDNLFISGYCVVVGDHSFLRYYIHILIT